MDEEKKGRKCQFRKMKGGDYQAQIAKQLKKSFIKTASNIITSFHSWPAIKVTNKNHLKH